MLGAPHTGSPAMFKHLALTLLAVLPRAAYAADVKMGDVTLRLIPPVGYCELNPAEKSDKRMLTAAEGMVAPGGNELLAMSADCTELRNWRTGRLPLLQHMAQYQTV